MNSEAEATVFTSTAEGRHIVIVGATQATTLPELVQAAPTLKQPEHLPRLCDAVNHLKYGDQYRVIHDASAFRAAYERRLKSETPNQPWQEGVVRVSDFGVCDTAEIQAPRREGSNVIFYAEDDYLHIPYRVTAPIPEQPDGPITYEPLPMSPLPE